MSSFRAYLHAIFIAAAVASLTFATGIAVANATDSPAPEAQQPTTQTAQTTPQPTIPPVAQPTIQNRFATKAHQPAFHLLGMTHVRNDLYNTLGLALDLSYYFNESLGAELRLAALRTRHSNAARNIRRQSGLTPDAWPQNYLTTLGLRYSFGYGKILMFGKFVTHFDPQFVFHAGTTFADGRILPTTLFGPALLTHFKHNIQLKIDLTASFQLENRTRGLVSTFGFAPFIGIGWSPYIFNKSDGGKP